MLLVSCVFVLTPHGPTRAYTGTHGHTRAHTGSHGLTRAHTGSHGHTRAHTGSHGHTRAHTGSHGLTRAHTGSHGLTDQMTTRETDNIYSQRIIEMLVSVSQIQTGTCHIDMLFTEM